jgi:flagellar biosynthesis GTPase FlhF
VKKIAVMKIIGALSEGDSECVCVSEMMEIVGELEESKDEKVSDCATLLLKRIYGKRAKRKGNGSGGVSASRLIRENERERKEKEEALKREEREKKEKEKEKKEKESERKEKERSLKENERLKKENEFLRQKQNPSHSPSKLGDISFFLQFHFLFLPLSSLSSSAILDPNSFLFSEKTVTGDKAIECGK